MKKTLSFFTILILFALPLKVLTLSLTSLTQAPVIATAPVTYYPLDEILYLDGKAVPLTKVQIYFEKPGLQPIIFVVDSNSNGEWYFAQKVELSNGSWTVRARSLGDPISDWSNPRIINSVVSGFMFGTIKIKYLPIFIILILILIISFILLIWSIVRVRSIKLLEMERKMKIKNDYLIKKLREKEREAAIQMVEANFQDLTRSLKEELAVLDEKFQKEGQLTTDEQILRDKLTDKLKKAEDEIEKKIKEL